MQSFRNLHGLQASYILLWLLKICQFLYFVCPESSAGHLATFSATTPQARTEKGGARHGGAKVKNNGAVAVARK